MTDPLSLIHQRASACKRHIVLAEGEDPRVVEGGLMAAKAGLAEITLLGREGRVRALLGADDSVAVVDLDTTPMFDEMAAAFYERRKHKGITEEQAREAARNPLNFSDALVLAPLIEGHH